MTNFLRSSSSSSQQQQNAANSTAALTLANGTGAGSGVSGSHSGSSSNLQATLVNHRSFDISSPSDFQHCFSIQPEILAGHHLTMKASTPTAADDPNGDLHLIGGPVGGSGGDLSSVNNSTTATSTSATNPSHILLSPVASPNLRLKIMLPSGADKRSIGLIHQKTLSPYSSRERIPSVSMKSNSIDNTDNPSGSSSVGQAAGAQLLLQHQQQPFYVSLGLGKGPHLQISASNTPRMSQKHGHHNRHQNPHHHQLNSSNNRGKYQKSNSIWYAGPEEETTKRSCSADVSQQINHHHHQHHHNLNHHRLVDTPPILTPNLPTTSSISSNNNPASTTSNSQQQSGSSSSHGSRKISRILYEIGSILSMVGLGKDYKTNQQQHNQVNSPQQQQQQQQQLPQQNQLLKKPGSQSTRRSQVIPSFILCQIVQK